MSATRKKRLLALVPAAALAALFALAYLLPLPERFFQPGSAVIELEDHSWAHVFLSPDEQWRIRIGLEEIDPAYVEALIRLEDKRFWGHHGVDPIAIGRAVLLNLRRGRTVSGASTLTMQLVRMREPRPRTFASKLTEAFRAVQIELRYSKKEILAAYLEYVPYGRNVEGIEAASLSYFGHRATALSAAEISTLLAVPQNPNRRFPAPRHSANLREARDNIAHRLLALGALPRGSGDTARTPEVVLAEVERAPVPEGLAPFPKLAPHAATWLRDQQRDRSRIKTTLDRGIQLLAERAMQGIKDDAERHGIHNGAVVVLDHRTSEVKALVGGFDFFDRAHAGQIAGFDAPRSPGSTLKPFLYAMGIDRGLLLPDFLVLDTPHAFGTYSPKNYDGRYSGLVRFEDALSRSLNVPFVNLLKRLGTDKFIETLRTMGAESLQAQPGFYGLSAAIGGIELTPLELAGLYAMLAREGRYVPVRWIGSDNHSRPASVRPVEPRRGSRRVRNEAAVSPSVAIVSPGAAYLTSRALSLKDRPDFPSRARFTGSPPHIHWKTGTSFGHRDAWAAGSGPRYTVVVWLGNLDNSPSISLVGADAAGPILFDLLEALGTKGETVHADHPPADLAPLEVCAYSGRPPGPACEHKKTVLALVKSVPAQRCPYHVAIDIDEETGLALTPACRASHPYRTEAFVAWPSSLRRWLDGEHRRLPEPPAYALGCEVAAARAAPSIISPPKNHVALLIPGLDRRRQEIPLAAEAGSGSSKLSWFVDGEYLGTIKPEERLWWTPAAGTHEIVVTDDTGRSAYRRLDVRSHL